MKKRILSLLILAAMIVTALPLSVLPVLAADGTVGADEPVWEEADYDALYTAQDASLISLDFFTSNSYWGEAIDIPVAPETMTSYMYAGEEYDFTKLEDRVYTEGEYYSIRRSDGNYHYYLQNGSHNARIGMRRKVRGTCSRYPP